MTLNQIPDQLKALSDKSTLTYNTKHSVGENQFGVKLDDIRKIAKEIKSDHPLALELWKTENFDARMLAMKL
jgi:3-methyladenine DNA glycosylase AlkD